MTHHDEQRYLAIQKRFVAVANFGALAIVLMIQASTLGDWSRFAVALAGQMAIFGTNVATSGKHFARFGARLEIPRAVFNALAGSVLYHVIGWPVLVWFWLPYNALAFDESNRSSAAATAMLAISCGIQGVIGLADGVSPWTVAGFAALTVICREMSIRRTDLIREMLRVAEAQHRELEAAHAELKAEIVARERAELELRQAQKLEAIGRLASGIAHEINTPVQFISDSLSFAKDGVAELIANAPDADRAYLIEELPRSLELALEGVGRVSKIVQSMKQFAHPGLDARGPLDINVALQDTLTIARHEYRLVADIETSFGELPIVECTGSELNQVFLNLVVNAAHAIADRVAGSAARGAIRVATAHDRGDVVVTVSDTGTGIPDDVCAHIFEPFFTTKSIGRGTGQGLAHARAVVERHGGHLSFTTAVGRGTTFTLRLPVVARAAAAA
ncbi:MAG TPA: HAMP domain-containing sensor histidine kinase [Acidimicrobiia bacterium]|jgi:signal transduction histidine kinase|nr:HAMP domain-containing sensor histidine kinase [Acidimicrobiia bacterium]